MAAGDVPVLSPPTRDRAWANDALCPAELPSAAARYLHAAALTYAHDTVSEQYIEAAQAIAPDHAEVLIAQYRFYFYKGRLGEALSVARHCLLKAARENGFAADWRLVRAEDSNFGAYEARLPRFFLFSLKAYAYLQLRLGRRDEGNAAVQKLLELDPSDKIGARVLLDVMTTAAGGEDE